MFVVLLSCWKDKEAAKIAAKIPTTIVDVIK
jgi:hypothetical protein